MDSFGYYDKKEIVELVALWVEPGIQEARAIPRQTRFKSKPRVRLPLSERLWRRVEKRGPDECWPWHGASTTRGYGVLGDQGKMIGAHRLAWELANGTSVPTGMMICHHCDNPPCCNPAHLFMGTPKENTQDMIRKGRARFRQKKICPS